MNMTVRISAEAMENEFFRILSARGFSGEKARQCADIFTRNSLDGIYSHGVNRFPRFVEYVEKGLVIPDAEAEPVHAAGALEQWNGNLGPGPLNARRCTRRAMELAEQYGMGCVALANTNHWMRGGTYGWEAAKAGYVFIGWTNTIANMPPWGASESRLGNNPLVIAVPYQDEAIVLDMAMSQFSFGGLEAAAMNNALLPVPGGYNRAGELTNVPREILETHRAVPAGYWKGAGLSLLLDLLAAILSGGQSTSGISKKADEYGVSQVFVAFDPRKLSNFSAVSQTVQAIIADYQAAPATDGHSSIRFPGERVCQTREQNQREGIPVNRDVWEAILTL